MNKFLKVIMAASSVATGLILGGIIHGDLNKTPDELFGAVLATFLYAYIWEKP